MTAFEIGMRVRLRKYHHAISRPFVGRTGVVVTGLLSSLSKAFYCVEVRFEDTGDTHWFDAAELEHVTAPQEAE